MTPARQPRAVPRLFLSVEEAAQAMGCSKTLFLEMVEDGRMPRPRRMNSKRVWSVAELDAYGHALPEDGEAGTVTPLSRPVRAI